MTAILISLTQGMVTQVVQVVKNPAFNAGDPREADSISGLEDALEKEMATHSSTPAWESHGQRSLVGYSPWGCKELDTTEQARACVQREWCLMLISASAAKVLALWSQTELNLNPNSDT